MPRSFVGSATVVAALALVPSMAVAQAPAAAPASSWGEIAGSVAAMTDYTFRGVSQTTKGPAVQGTLEYTKELGPVTGYVGTFLSNVAIPDTSSRGNLDAKVEVDLAFGLRGDVNEKLKWDVGYIRYMYPFTDYPKANSMSLDWTEVGVKLTYDLGFATPVLNYFHSPNYSVGGGKSHYGQTGFDVPLPWYDITLGARIGRLVVANNANFGLPDYTDWSIGISRDFPELLGVNIGLTYTDTNVKKNAPLSNKSDTTTGNVDERVFDTTQPRIILRGFNSPVHRDLGASEGVKNLLR